MRLSFQWLKTYVKLPPSVTPEKVAEILKLSTVEVEGAEHQGEALENIVIGRVLKAEKHSNADKLLVCAVDTGKEMLQIVCGGTNVRAGMLVAVAKIGASVRWHGEGEFVEMKLVSLRGVESRGMICASNEVGLADMFPSKNEREIMDVSHLSGVRPGTPLAEALGLDDVIFDIDNKSLTNRPDLWGHYGMAREVAALFRRPLAAYKTSPIRLGKERRLKVDIARAEDCSRYMAVAVEGVTTTPSPSWMQKRLLSAGVRPINTIVDIANYVMLDIGEPMHAFDAVRLSEKNGTIAIEVRRAKNGEAFHALDGRRYDLNGDDIVIVSGGRVLALAGVMGGQEGSVSPSTTSIVFEAANFHPSFVRRTSTRLGLRTESSARFEKSLDPNLCESALRKAVELTLELCPGARVASAIADKKHFRLNQGPIRIPVSEMTRKIGVEIPYKEINRILTALGFSVKKTGEMLAIGVPTWRAMKDISIPEDIVEEVARIYGYHHIPAQLPVFPIVPPAHRSGRLEQRITDALVRGLGYTEVQTYSFVSPVQVRHLGEKEDAYLELENPLSKDRPFLRRNLVGNLLECLAKNRDFSDELRLLEIGKVYRKEEKGEEMGGKNGGVLPRQDTWITAVCMRRGNDSMLEMAKRALVTALGPPAGEAGAAVCEYRVRVVAKPLPWQHPGKTGEIVVGGQVVGFLSEAHPKVSRAFDISGRVGVLELNMSALASLAAEALVFYKPVSVFPAVSRDIAILADQGVLHANFFDAIAGSDPLIHKVELFDVYQDDTMEAGKRSLAYRLTLQSKDHTLTAEEADAAVRKVLEILKKRFNATPRA